VRSNSRRNYASAHTDYLQPDDHEACKALRHRHATKDRAPDDHVEGGPLGKRQTLEEVTSRILADEVAEVCTRRENEVVVLRCWQTCRDDLTEDTAQPGVLAEVDVPGRSETHDADLPGYPAVRYAQSIDTGAKCPSPRITQRRLVELCNASIPGKVSEKD
jgi:hypothetical protein